MIEQLLPEVATAVETFEDVEDAALFAEEEAIVTRAVDKRRREFATGRYCAHTAMRKLGLGPRSVLTGERGEPIWPRGLVGSITHCGGYRGCAIAPATELAGLGIDAEPNLPLPRGVLRAVARSEELPMLSQLGRAVPGVRWDRLLFSAKESIYKVWFPLTRCWLNFGDVVVRIELDSVTASAVGGVCHSGAGETLFGRSPGCAQGVFHAQLLVSGPRVAGAELVELSGEWLATSELVLTALALHAHLGAPLGGDRAPGGDLGTLADAHAGTLPAQSSQDRETRSR